MKIKAFLLSLLFLLSCQIGLSAVIEVPVAPASGATSPYIMGSPGEGGVAPAAGATDFTADASMYGYWMMEQATGADAPDGAGNNALPHISDASGPTQSADHMEGSYSSDLNVAASDAYLLTNAGMDADFPGKTGGYANSISIGCWVKMDESNVRNIMGISSPGDVCSYQIRFDATNMVFRTSTNGYGWYTITGGTAITDDGSTWYHVVGVFDDTNNLIHIYVNGVSDAVAVAYPTSLFLGAGNFIIGVLDGHVDECFLMKRVLTPTEILSIYDHGLAGNR